MDDTPETLLSNMISRCVEYPTEDAFEQLLAQFLSAHVGVIARGAPSGTVGPYRSQGDIALQRSRSPRGEPVILVCADPEVFMQRFGGPFNAGMDGESVAKTALADPECAGIQVNSAASVHSIIIARDLLVRRFSEPSPQKVASAKPWWKFW